MAIQYYDNALYEKLKAWVPADISVCIKKPDETARLFKLVDDKNKDKEFTLPLISLSRDTSFELLETTKSPLSFNGKRIGGDDKKSILLNAIPISIFYQIDIYTQKYEEADSILREIIFKFLNNPKLTVTFPYNGVNLQHYAYTRLSSTVSDNSDIPERLYEGEFTRWTIQLEIKDAYLFSIPIKNNWHMEEESSSRLELINGNNFDDNIEGLEGDYQVEIPDKD